MSRLRRPGSPAAGADHRGDFLGDSRDELGRCQAARLQRQPAGEELVQQNAERVRVGGHADPLTRHLLRARVRRRHDRVRLGHAFALSDGVHQLRDPEVEKLRVAVTGHEDVAGLQVPVRDQLAVGVGDRVADPEEEAKTLLDAQAARVAPCGDRLAVDELHHQVRRAVVRAASVEETGHAGVRQPGENLALRTETLGEQRAGYTAPNQLDRGPCLVGAIGTLGEVDRSHPAFPDRLENPPGAETRAFHGPLLERLGLGGDHVRQVVVVPGVVDGQEIAHLRLELRVAGARLGDTLLPGVRVEGNELVEQLAQPPEALTPIRHRP